MLAMSLRAEFGELTEVSKTKRKIISLVGVKLSNV